MKKLFSILAVLFVLGTANVFALGIGLQGGYSAGTTAGGGGAVTFKTDKSPIVFAVTGNFGSNWMDFGITGDYWLANPKIEGTWGYYYGIGVAGGFQIRNSNNFYVGLGPRALIGTNIFLLDRKLEFYFQGAWQPTFDIFISGTKDDGPGFNLVNFPVNVGFRFWL